MRHVITITLLLLGAGTHSAFGSSSPANPQDAKDGQKGVKVGVVDLKQCFDKDRYERIRELDVELRTLAKKYAAEIRSTQKKMQNLKVQIEGLTPDLKAYWDKLGELKQAETELEFKKKYGKQQYVNRLIGLQIEVYNEIRRVVEIYARENDFDLILRVEEPNLDEEDPRTISQRIASRVVLYHSQTLDITDKVIKLLNEEYLKMKAGGVKTWKCPHCKKSRKKRVCPDCGRKRP